jgi:hypothetical protein
MSDENENEDKKNQDKIYSDAKAREEWFNLTPEEREKGSKTLASILNRQSYNRPQGVSTTAWHSLTDEERAAKRQRLKEFMAATIISEYDEEAELAKEEAREEGYNKKTNDLLSDMGIFEDSTRPEGRDLIRVDQSLKSKGFKFSLTDRDSDLIEMIDLFFISGLPFAVTLMKIKFFISTLLIVKFKKFKSYLNFYKINFIKIEEKYIMDHAKDVISAHPLIARANMKVYCEGRRIAIRYPDENLSRHVGKCSEAGMFSGEGFAKKVGYMRVD